MWLQIANVFQYVGLAGRRMSWGAGIMTSPARVLATLAWLALGVGGLRAMRRDVARSWPTRWSCCSSCGTLGVAAYLNLKAGASLGWGFLPDDAPHEARERDYFFVLGFWAWGCFAGAGAVALARRLRALPPRALGSRSPLPLVGQLAQRRPVARAGGERGARSSRCALLEAPPPRAVLFLDGDNDSYPIWFAQQVEGRATRRHCR